jgi:DNA-directed RNA polymerase specialized sigma24 family protein
MTKEELRQHRSIKLEICQIERRLEELEPIQRDYYDKVTKLINLYKSKLEQLIASQLKIEKAIETLTPLERELIRLRYIDGYDWLEVSATIHYEASQTYRLHSVALQKLKKL